MKIRTFNAEVLDNPLQIITDWYSLGAYIKVPPYKLSHAKQNQGDLIKRYSIKGRTVYESMGSLKHVQQRLQFTLQGFHFEPDMGHVISYKKGVNPGKEISALAGWCKYLTHFDIKKFYDSIDFQHISSTLEEIGFHPSGAKLITVYCTVKGKNGKRYLQQGSPVSPVVSNLVGHYQFDREIIEILEDIKRRHPRMEYKILRYCDNVYVGWHGTFPIEVIKEYKSRATEVMKRARFQTHKWNTVPKDHPKRNQKALGMVINEQARIENYEFQRIRAILFNACRGGLLSAAVDYFEKNPTDLFDTYSHPKLKFQVMEKKFTQFLQGKVSYIGSVSEKQGKQLKKLLEAVKYLQTNYYSSLTAPDSLPESVFTVLKEYRKQDMTVETYVKNLKETLDGSMIDLMGSSPRDWTTYVYIESPSTARLDVTIPATFA